MKPTANSPLLKLGIEKVPPIVTTAVEGDLCEKPEGVKESGVVRRSLETGLGSVCRGSGNKIGVDTEAQVLDNLPPLTRRRQDAQSDVPHRRLLQPKIVFTGIRTGRKDRMKPQAYLALTRLLRGKAWVGPQLLRYIGG